MCFSFFGSPHASSCTTSITTTNQNQKSRASRASPRSSFQTSPLAFSPFDLPYNAPAPRRIGPPRIPRRNQYLRFDSDMDLTDSGAQRLPFDIDLNETPVSSPTLSAAAGGEGSGGGGKGKVVLFDINALPSEAEGEDGGGLVNLGMHTVRDASSVGNSNDASVTSSNLLFVGDRLDVMRASSSVTRIVKSSPVDDVQQRLNFGMNLKEADPNSMFIGRHWASDCSMHALPLQNLGEKCLQALREFIFNNHGILEDGWHVEFLYCQNRCKTFIIYCSPDGNKFESMFDVASHLGLVSNRHSLVPCDRSNGFALAQNRLHSQRKRKESLMYSRTKEFKECQEQLKCSLAGEFSFGIEATTPVACKPHINPADNRDSPEENVGSSDCKDGFPVQFEDFFILSVGKVDPRPSYHCNSQIWPVGYKSVWHDKVTGSLFICDVSDGGDSGPVFKVQRYPCCAQSMPIGSTILFLAKFSVDNNITIDTCSGSDDQEDINLQMIFSDHSPPHLEFNNLSGAGAASYDASDSLAMCSQQTDSNCLLQDHRTPAYGNGRVGDNIGEFLVEGRSSSSVWKKVSENFVHACHKVYKQRGMCKFCCRHDAYGWWSPWQIHENTESSESLDSLAKFCHVSGPSSVPHHILSYDELTTGCKALEKWLDQDRFGLDVEFVQEILERLPGVHTCRHYTFLNKRSNKLKSQTVGSGFLVAKRTINSQGVKESENALSKKHIKQLLQNPPLKDICPPCKPLSAKFPAYLIGDVLQSWELLWRFSDVLGLEEPLSFKELEDELVECHSFALRSSAPLVNRNCQRESMTAEAEFVGEGARVIPGSETHSVYTGKKLTKVHCSLLKVLLAELQSKMAVSIDLTREDGDCRPRKRRKKDMDNLIFTKPTILDLLPINEFTWPELARRYMLALSCLEGNLDSVDIANRESSTVFNCFGGKGGALCTSLPRVAGTEADALLLAEATKKIFGTSKNTNFSKNRKNTNNKLNVDSKDSDVLSARKAVRVNDGGIPDWAQVLEPVRKLPTNVGARIRKCIYEALDRNPPEWAKQILEHSISKEVYKGNASGPTKKAVLSLLADICGENQENKPNKKGKNKGTGTVSDVIMKQCRKVLRCAVAADEDKVLCNLLGKSLTNPPYNDDKALRGFPNMVSRPLDFRTIDLRLSFGAYGGSHEAFVEDVREVWHKICTAYAHQPDLVHLAETLSQNFEEHYKKEVLTLVHKLSNFRTLECLSSEAKKEMEDVLEHASDLPKAPWDEGVCKVCSVDKDDDNVLLCDMCDSGYHTYCLSPPLARIPEGNWYCPSCAVGCISQGVPQISPIISKSQRRKHQGELTYGFLEALVHLGTTMEVKDYWEYSVEERILLLKFLGEEVLNTANIREHLDQCAPISADLQQKLRSLSSEWRNLKFREDVLAENVAKGNPGVLNGVGQSGAGGMAFVLPSLPYYDKLMGQPLHRSSFHSSPSNGLVHLKGALQQCGTNDFSKLPSWFYSKNSLEQHSPSCESLFTEIPDCEYRVSQRSGEGDVFVSENPYAHWNSSCVIDEFSRQNLFLSVPRQQQYDPSRDYAASLNLRRETESNRGTDLIMPVCKGPQGYVKPENFLTGHHGSIQPDSNVFQGGNVEASFITNKISILQESIANLESKLLKVSLRKDLLGRDSAGRLYWAFYRPGSSPWVVIEGSMMVQHKSILEGERALSSNYSYLKSAPIGTEGLLKFKEQTNSCLYLNGRNNDVPASSPWFSCQSVPEIEELIRWLKDHHPVEKELVESLSQRLKFGYEDFNKAETFVQDIPRSTLKPIDIEKTVNYNALVTNALIVLEKMYGPILESNDANITQSQNAEASSRERMYRCECLEPIWPSRHHCHLCHRSFSTRSELRGHNDGKCISVVHPLKDSKVKNDVPKGKEITIVEQGQCSDKTRQGESGMGLDVASGSAGCLKDLASPFNFEEISAKFITRSSNEELVKEIGLLGTNGVPSFLRCESPYLSDPSLKLIASCRNEVHHSEKTKTVESQSQQSVEGSTIRKRHANFFNHWNKRFAVDDINEEAQKIQRSNLISERIDHSSLQFSCLKVGNSDSILRDSSLRNLVGRGAQILGQLKINLLDIDAVLPEEALKPSKSSLEERCVWRAYVKSATSVFEMVQATIVLENMIETEYLRNEWWNWSSLSAAAKIATVSSLALRIFTLDAAVVYEKLYPHSFAQEINEFGDKSSHNYSSSLDPTSNPKKSSQPISRTNSLDPTDNCKQQTKSGKKRKDSRG